jgi:hypothetical protein
MSQNNRKSAQFTTMTPTEAEASGLSAQALEDCGVVIELDEHCLRSALQVLVSHLFTISLFTHMFHEHKDMDGQWLKSSTYTFFNEATMTGIEIYVDNRDGEYAEFKLTWGTSFDRERWVKDAIVFDPTPFADLTPKTST